MKNVAAGLASVVAVAWKVCHQDLHLRQVGPAPPLTKRRGEQKERWSGKTI